MNDGQNLPPKEQVPPKPALLKGGMVLCWVYAVMLVLLLLMLPALDEMSAVSSNSSALPGGRELQAEFVGDLKSTSQLFIIPLLALSIVAAYGLAKNRYWSRAMMMTLLILGVVLIPPGLASPAMYGASIALAVFGWWYLYRKANVVDYYRKIRR